MSPVESPEEIRDAIVKGAGDAAARVAERADQAGTRIAKKADKAARRIAKKADKRGVKFGARGFLFGAKARARERLRPVRETKLKAQLAKTSRDLAHETSDLGQAIDSLNAIIRANRRAGASGRTRLFAGVALGAFVTYHLDAEHGSARRAATAHRIKSVVGR